MLFRRRTQPRFHLRLREFLWPRAGWRRSTTYVAYRVARMPGSAYAIAAGFACGSAISFTPFVGFHLVLGALMAWAMRSSIVASAVGTVVGNPWTFPFIWWWIYHLGLWVGADVAGAHEGVAHNGFRDVFVGVLDALLRFDIAYLVERVWPVWWPMFVGGVPTAVAAWLLSYWGVRTLIEGYRRARRHARHRRLGGDAVRAAAAAERRDEA